MNHTPDILNCLANLSNDEVFTPPELAGRMLDLLPREVFRSSSTRFLDPGMKSGVFLREIAKRLLVGLEEEFPDLQQRIDHIMKHQLFGVAITTNTSLISRRTLYCSKAANGEYSVTTVFDDAEGNVRFPEAHHRWDGRGRCECCGASKGEYARTDGRETYAYPFIHLPINKIFKERMQFDVIIGNPPYQMSDGGAQASARPIYHLFVEQAKRINPNYLCMIIPARFFTGGKGLDAFRDTMIHDRHIQILHDYADSGECFQGVDIKGGVCYFLWNKHYDGVCEVHRYNAEGETISHRPLVEKGDDIFIRENTLVSIKHKVQNHKEKTVDLIASPRKPYSLAGDAIKSTAKYGLPPMSDSPIRGGYRILGLDERMKRVYKYLPHDYPFEHNAGLMKYKVFISESYGCGEVGDIPATPVLATPGDLCTETFIQLGPFDDERTANNFLTYLRTKFFRALVGIRKQTQHATRTVYQFVPLQDFSHPWTDEMLYEKYGLDEREVAFIESMIRPMEEKGGEV